ncbi:MAG: 30S ribosomal protein S8 [Chlamydiae bacterium]|nr:30S ribosomal protein S8 [Chlamydiota bacterium]
MLNDPVADLLTRIRNALSAQHKYVDVPTSKMSTAIVDVLVQTGFVNGFVQNAELRKTRIYLKYDEQRRPVIKGLKRISSPGRRKYVSATEIPMIRRGLGVAILSTSKGVLQGKIARKENAGGELLCSVW